MAAMTQPPLMRYAPGALARPAVEVTDALLVAAWERQHDRMDDRIRGVVEAGRWLGQARAMTPVTGEARMALPKVIRDEIGQAQAVVWGLPTAPRRVDRDYALGVVQMLTYAIDPTAPMPVTLVHRDPPQSREQ